jgi:uracil-DNA glycosylase
MILLLGGSSKKAFLKISDIDAVKSVKKQDNHTFKKTSFESIGFETIVGLSFHPSPLVYNMPQKREQLISFFKKIRENLC